MQMGMSRRSSCFSLGWLLLNCDSLPWTFELHLDVYLDFDVDWGVGVNSGLDVEGCLDMDSGFDVHSGLDMDWDLDLG